MHGRYILYLSLVVCYIFCLVFKFSTLISLGIHLGQIFWSASWWCFSAHYCIVPFVFPLDKACLPKLYVYLNVVELCKCGWIIHMWLIVHFSAICFSMKNLLWNGCAFGRMFFVYAFYHYRIFGLWLNF